MLFPILVIIIIIAVIYGLTSGKTQSLNERLYLKRRGYEPPLEFDAGPPVSKDTRLFNLLESLSDVSPYSRRRAAEDLSRMCASGRRDSRMLPALIAALDDSDASVRGAAAAALSNLGGPDSLEALERRAQVEESVHARASIQRAIERLGKRS